ncbi:NAD(P)/FAD-dependent oxidoreductase [Hymenobacter saemangeumensis]|uniref:NAD(P)/FAD-dependent oxidoreductase n=1 Tax=Hymenobacter saemangeumensis TaxID=1084522 RepID=A0ABP8IK90_9BACT
MTLATAPLCFDTLVVGAGQAGLAAAYYLQQAGVAFCVLDAAPAVGYSWSQRYDSLRLFSPAWVSGLPGYAWPGPRLHYPSKDEAAAYLRDYAAHFRFPIALNQRVERLRAAPNGRYHVSTAAGTVYEARRVIIATGPYSGPAIPAFAAHLPSSVLQLHSQQYQRPAQLPGAGPVAVVGSGNSALQIAADLAGTGRPVFVAFDEKTPSVPNNQLTWSALLLFGLIRIPRHTRLGRFIHQQPEPVVSGDLTRLRGFANAHFMGRATGALPDGSLQGRLASTPPLQAVVWATGFRPDFSWLQLPILQPDGSPRHHRGLTEAPGIAFLGLQWLDSRRSALLNGAGPDARRVVQALLRLPPDPAVLQ